VKILILGAGGFLGRAVVRRLSADGHEICCVIRSPVPPTGDPNVRYVEATLDDTQAVLHAVASADYILHLAWDTTPGTSIGQPTLEVINNLLPTLRLLEAINRPGSCPLVFVSTAGATYAAGDQRTTENSTVNPASYYGAAKLATEMFLRAYAMQTGNAVIVVRPSNVYGPGQQPRRQFGIVPTMMRALHHGETFHIWGDGQTERDFLFLDDFVELFVEILRRRWRSFHLFNAAAESNCSINELRILVERISGKRLSVRNLPARGVDTSGAPLDCAKARDELGWKARTDLETGLTATWRWFEKLP
jgi:UDP-glucose 4-epimerase